MVDGVRGRGGVERAGLPVDGEFGVDEVDQGLEEHVPGVVADVRVGARGPDGGVRVGVARGGGEPLGPGDEPVGVRGGAGRRVEGDVLREDAGGGAGPYEVLGPAVDGADVPGEVREGPVGAAGDGEGGVGVADDGGEAPGEGQDDVAGGGVGVLGESGGGPGGESEAPGGPEQPVPPGALGRAQGGRAEQSVEGPPVGRRESGEGVAGGLQPLHRRVGVEDLLVGGLHLRHQTGQGLGQGAQERFAHRISPPGFSTARLAYRAV